MLQDLLYLAVIITVVYSDCCTKLKSCKIGDKDCDIANPPCSNESDVDCHMEHFGIHCCNSGVQKAIVLFADLSGKIVSYS